MFCYSIGLRLDFIMNGQMLMGKASWTFLFFLVRPSLRVVSVFLGTPLAQHRHGEILQMRFFSSSRLFSVCGFCLSVVLPFIFFESAGQPNECERFPSTWP